MPRLLTMRTQALVFAAIAALILSPAASGMGGQFNDKAPDGTPFACTFSLALAGGDDPTGSSRDCGGYSFNLYLHPFQANLSTIAVSPAGKRTSSDTLTYHIADMPLSEKIPKVMTLLNRAQQVTRIVCFRDSNALHVAVASRELNAKTEFLLRPH